MRMKSILYFSCIQHIISSQFEALDMQSCGLVVMISRSQLSFEREHISEKVPCSTHGETNIFVLIFFIICPERDKFFGQIYGNGS